MYIVYKHTNKINNKVYIGITSRTTNERWGKDGYNYKSSPHFYNAIQLYGWDNFEHEILYDNLTKEEACLKEQQLIELYNSTNPNFGYNQTTGGELFHMSDVVKEKISNALIGNKNGSGHPCSEDKKQKISIAQKGRKLTEEHKSKLSASAKNRHVVCSEEKRKILSKNYPNKKKVYCEDLDVVYESVQECGRQLGASATNVSKACKGRCKTVKGHKIRYYDDTINA